MMQAPTAYDPYAHSQLALDRWAHVLERLAATGVLTATQARAYAATPLELA
jgi:membrane peptidoglycan carboxypeptidase